MFPFFSERSFDLAMSSTPDGDLTLVWAGDDLEVPGPVLLRPWGQTLTSPA